MRAVLWFAALGIVLAVAAAPCQAAVYVWKDEKGVVHMTDRKPENPAGNVEVIGPETNRKPAGQKNREEKVADMQKQAEANPRFAELALIAQEYHKSHTYSMADYFVCIDMALEMNNMLKTRGFDAKVVAGTTKADLAATPRDKFRMNMDHAWVVVELAPGLHVPIETTAGLVVTGRKPHSEYYYQGLVFESTKQAKDLVATIGSSNENCQQAKGLVDDFNANYAGRPGSPALLEAKGRADAKIKDCNDGHKKYDDLIAKNYRTFY
jgi:hypothetical protein